jgi:transposase
MSKQSVSTSATAYAGIDVSAATLAVALQRENREGFEQRQFANSAIEDKH